MSMVEGTNRNFLADVQNYSRIGGKAIREFLPEISSIVAGIAATVFTNEFIEELADPEGDTTFPLLGVATVSVLHSAVKYCRFGDQCKARYFRTLLSVPWASLAGVSLGLAIQFGKGTALKNACWEYYQAKENYDSVEGLTGCDRLENCENGSNRLDSCLYFQDRAMNECKDLMSQNSTYFQCFVQEGGEPWRPDNWQFYPYAAMGGAEFHCYPNISTLPLSFESGGYEYIEGYPVWYRCNNHMALPPTFNGKIVRVDTGVTITDHLSLLCANLYRNSTICQPADQLSHIWPDGALVFSDHFFQEIAKIKKSSLEANAIVQEYANCTLINPFIADYLHAKENYERLLSAQYHFSLWDFCEVIDDRSASSAVEWGVAMLVLGSLEVLTLAGGSISSRP